MELERNQSRFRRKLKAPIIPLLFVICITILSLLAFLSLKSIKSNKTLNASVVSEALSNIKELATTKYSYTKILEVKNDKKFNGLSIPFTQNYFLLQYEGYIKSGVDLSKLDLTIDKDKNAITVKIEKSKVLDHVINQESIHIYDEKSGIFNKLSLQSMVDEITAQKNKSEQEMLKKGLLDESDKNAKKLIEEVLKTMGFKEINVIFK